MGLVIRLRPAEALRVLNYLHVLQKLEGCPLESSSKSCFPKPLACLTDTPHWGGKGARHSGLPDLHAQSHWAILIALSADAVCVWAAS